MAGALEHSTKSDPLFQPLTIRGLTLKNRIMSTAHACGTDDGSMPKLRFQRYHEEKARGGLALTMFGGSSNIAPDSPNVFRQLDVGTDTVIPHLREFSDRIHRHGCAIMCQITHLGRRGEDTAGWWLPTIAPTRSRETRHSVRRRAPCPGFLSHLHSLVVTMNPKPSLIKSRYLDP